MEEYGQDIKVDTVQYGEYGVELVIAFEIFCFLTDQLNCLRSVGNVLFHKLTLYINYDHFYLK